MIVSTCTLEVKSALSTRGLTPTEVGQKFYERAKRVLEEADEAEIDARDAGAGLTGRLRVSATVTFARLHVVPRLPAFLAANPGLTMDVILDDRVIDLMEYQPVDEIGRDLIRSLRRGKRAADGTWTAAGTAD